jgi:hypothetical protein
MRSNRLPGQRPYVTVAEALDDLPDVDSPEAETIPNHEPTFHSDRMLDAFARRSREAGFEVSA